MNSNFNKFYNKSIEERINILKENNLLDEIIQLDSNIANNMVENYIMNYNLPLGLAFNFVIDDEKYIIPMAIEEPSVIAAASNGAKTLGNIKTKIEKKHAIGQIVLYNVEDIYKAENIINKNIDYLIKKSIDVSTSMVKRGGGLKKIWTKSFLDEGFLTIYFSIDTCDAMGANTVNTILEYLSKDIENLTKSSSLLKIISNNSTDSIVTASANIPVEKLHKDLDIAIDIAKKIELATKYANLDPYRCATHNKGAMNGIDAVVLATGNDWRAVEASIHTYASSSGKYSSITSWEYDENSKSLIGRIEIPVPVATIGGTISVHPIAKWSLKTLKNPSAKKLASIIASIGLAQNFSALRALVTVGIQKGHMELHAKSVAVQAGANNEEIDIVVSHLIKHEKFNVDIAKSILENIRNKEV